MSIVQFGGRIEITTYIIISNEDFQKDLKIVPTISKMSEDNRIYQSELEDAFDINF